ncbi:hypothetical protein HS1genome_0608 [Sulfodiicoccus acidiphilus]|uniref:Uncharacterized protein n=1 Tax=Sulfodiicoccus acidiphilus TaxID=1670455 RepID=A0A348B217_9CREN|nr:hypothetical protein [Sulfodiicoccus acidiphilus]BBD72219.1 hypothetical protein HS1genome_0608 [Sulfodiicoccus acidiphilus]GGU02942.1 hypothetical protein GCM10007116_19950 [Sulfodiicoccus acidiphilus]
MVLLAELVPLAGVMVVAIVAVLSYVSRVKTQVGLFFLYFAFIMMITMLIGASVYLYSPSDTTLGVAVGVNMAAMIAALSYFFSTAESLTRRVVLRDFVLGTVAALVVLNEGLMGTTFGLAQFGTSPFSTPFEGFLSSVNSYWFFYPMMAEMLSLYLILERRGVRLGAAYALVGATAFPPTAFDLTQWRLVTPFLTLMVCGLGLLLSKGVWRGVYAAVAASAMMTFFTEVPYDLAIAVAMGYFYFYALSAEFGLSPKPLVKQHPNAQGH